MRNDFSTLDIVKALSIPRERLRDWMNNGFVVPSIKSGGQGTKAIFTRDDIYLVALFVDLLKKGFKRYRASDLIKKASGAFKRNGSKSLAFIVIYFMKNQNNAILAELIYDPVTRWDKIDLRSGGRISSAVAKENEKIASHPNDLLPKEDSQMLTSTREWENIHVVNFKNLKQKVDLDLSAFG